jgi:hypothetical protein
MVPVVVGARRSTHPELYDRMIAAGVTPEYLGTNPVPPTSRTNDRPARMAAAGHATMVRSVFGRSREAHPEKSPMQQKVRAAQRARTLNNSAGGTGNTRTIKGHDPWLALR